METVPTQSNSTSFLITNQTVLCVDNQDLIAKSKDELQKVAYKKREKHNLKIFPLKSSGMLW